MPHRYGCYCVGNKLVDKINVKGTVLNTPFFEEFSAKFSDIYCKHTSGVTRTDIGISTRARWLIFTFSLIHKQQFDVIYVLLNGTSIEVKNLLNCGANTCRVTEAGVRWDSLALAKLLPTSEKLLIETTSVRLYLFAQEHARLLRVLLSGIQVVSDKEVQS